MMHQQYLLNALEQAKIRQGFTAPNPAVGAVIVLNNQVIAQGYHQGAGHPHAEVVTLAQISPEQAQQATLYVTLEPCCHWGKTPPCVEKIIESGIKRVVFATIDPNPLIQGKGQAALQQAGVECLHLPCDEISEFYQDYRYWVQHEMPWVISKIAMSLDGKIAGSKGMTTQITGQELAQFTHEQRKSAQAILTTAKTVIIDDPQLNCRLENQIIAKPIFLIDSNLSVSPDSKIFKTSDSITIFHGEQYDVEKAEWFIKQDIHCIPIPEKNGLLNLSLILAIIAERGFYRIWCEAGGQLFSSLFQEHLLQQAYFYLSAKTLGPHAYAAFHDVFNFASEAKAITWQQFGPDVLTKLNFFQE